MTTDIAAGVNCLHQHLVQTAMQRYIAVLLVSALVLRASAFDKEWRPTLDFGSGGDSAGLDDSEWRPALDFGSGGDSAGLDDSEQELGSNPSEGSEEVHRDVWRPEVELRPKPVEPSEKVQLRGTDTEAPSPTGVDSAGLAQLERPRPKTELRSAYQADHYVNFRIQRKLEEEMLRHQSLAKKEEEVDTHSSPPAEGQTWCMFKRKKSGGYFYYKLAQCTPDSFTFTGRDGLPGKIPKLYSAKYKVKWARKFDYDVEEDDPVLGVWKYRSDAGEFRLAWCRGDISGRYPQEDEEDRSDSDFDALKLQSCSEADLQPITREDPTYRELSNAISENICLSKKVSSANEAIDALCSSTMFAKKKPTAWHPMFLSWESPASESICEEGEYSYGTVYGNRMDITKLEFESFCRSKKEARLEGESMYSQFSAPHPTDLPFSGVADDGFTSAVTGQEPDPDAGDKDEVASGDVSGSISVSYICVNKNSHNVRLVSEDGEELGLPAHIMLFQKMMQVEKGQVCGLRYI